MNWNRKDLSSRAVRNWIYICSTIFTLVSPKRKIEVEMKPVHPRSAEDNKNVLGGSLTQISPGNLLDNSAYLNSLQLNLDNFKTRERLWFIEFLNLRRFCIKLLTLVYIFTVDFFETQVVSFFELLQPTIASVEVMDS